MVIRPYFACMAERPDMSPLLPDIKIPTLVIVGEEDQITTVAEMHEMFEAIPRAKTFVKVGLAGHMATLEQPNAVNRSIKEFLDEVPKTKRQ